jgi:hypothetical protein
MYSYGNTVNVEKMLGRTIKEVRGLEQYSDEVVVEMDNGDTFTFLHFQDCCESVSLEDFILTGELVGPAARVYESSDGKDGDYETETWTFYRIETMKGSLFMRWVGSSNGYYSEAVDIVFKEADNATV